MQTPGHGSITDIGGVRVGHYTDARRPTGCTVLLCPPGTRGGVDVRGAAPGTRETDLLSPLNLVEDVHAVLLSGGSAFGLDAAAGVMGWLEAQGIGFPVGAARVPIVPAAILFDLGLGDSAIRPDAAAGRAACAAASATPPACGSVGAGAGATVGKLFGPEHAMKGGIGTASVRVGRITVGALVAVNALGDVIDPQTHRIIAGSRRADGSARGTRRALLGGELPAAVAAGMSTSIGIVATDACLDKAQCTRLAQAGHDGLARVIDPVHTLWDGDTLFGLATWGSGVPGHMVVLATMAAHAVAQAVRVAVRAASGRAGVPSSAELGWDRPPASPP